MYTLIFGRRGEVTIKVVQELPPTIIYAGHTFDITNQVKEKVNKTGMHEDDQPPGEGLRSGIGLRIVKEGTWSW